MSYGPPPPWPPQPAPWQPPPPPPRRRRFAWVPVVGGVVVVALLAALAFVWFGRGSGEIFLEPAASAGADPFDSKVDSLALAANAQPVDRTNAPGGGGTVTQRGGEPGLYGGTRSVSSCDVDQLVAFLQANPAQGQAWAQVQGIGVSDIPTYVGSLTPVVLRADTRVTNHGFSQGRATPRQAVLEAGTAVLVDAFGVPRVRCYCGNPLLQPAAVPVTPAYSGTRWAGFDPDRITVVVQHVTVVTVVTLVDLGTGERFDRPAGSRGEDDRDAGGAGPTPTPTRPPPTTAPPPLTVPPDVTVGQGDVQVTLLWQGPADLDLRVTDPAGSTVSFTSPTAPSGGQLDVDANVGCGPAGSDTHVENVFWPLGAAPPGPYSAEVNLFQLCGVSSVGYQLTVIVDGRVVDTRTGTLTGGTTAPVTFSR